jgi:hypothetical protein
MHRPMNRALLAALLLLVPLAAPLRAAEQPPARNLLSDPGFVATEKHQDRPIESLVTPVWRFFELAPPSRISFIPPDEKQGGSVTITGGKCFFHSPPFDVQAGRSYRISLVVKGDGAGKVSAGFLWWKTYSDDHMEMARPHWTRPEDDGPPVGAEALSRSVVFTAPEGATRGYVRFVVAAGSVTITGVEVAEVAPQ